MFQAERRTVTILAGVEQAHLSSRTRKLRKRDGRVESSEAGARRPPRPDC